MASRDSRRLLGARRVAREAGARLPEMCEIIEQLKEAGLVETNGGGSIAWCRDPAKVSLYNIARAVGERFQVRCARQDDEGASSFCKECPLRGLSKSVRSEVVGLFKTRKLSELLPMRA